ncbi:unnamed protein product, partial [Brugia timori]
MTSACDRSVMPRDDLNEAEDLLLANEVIIGRFVVEEKIGQGSFGQIFR